MTHVVIITPAGEAAFRETVTALDEVIALRYLRDRASMITDTDMSEGYALYAIPKDWTPPAGGSAPAVGAMV